MQREILIDNAIYCAHIQMVPSWLKQRKLYRNDNLINISLRNTLNCLFSISSRAESLERYFHEDQEKIYKLPSRIQPFTIYVPISFVTLYINIKKERKRKKIVFVKSSVFGKILPRWWTKVSELTVWIQPFTRYGPIFAVTLCVERKKKVRFCQE